MWGHDAHQRAKLLICQAMQKSTLNAYLQTDSISNSCLSTKRRVGHERLLCTRSGPSFEAEVGLSIDIPAAAASRCAGGLIRAARATDANPGSST